MYFSVSDLIQVIELYVIAKVINVNDMTNLRVLLFVLDPRRT
jgi:hypothetical protein